MTQELQKTPDEAKERVAVSSTRLLECVELAIIANGGGAHKKEMCSCDASVGMCPCEYCAIWDALNKTWNYLLDLKGKHTIRGEQLTAAVATGIEVE